ncbi:hypothetical protein NBRC111894_996 [Sporolactobacillus inulinus]|uniref:Uncharacterized protein n=1 Tax=Sporolactobacillus inulinus TaxID=2078 RepID=A0A4Y1Z8R4_9BACL|nr:hypothetical protein NBRC111894_996 [Sporolactobacillus inulinus]
MSDFSCENVLERAISEHSRISELFGDELSPLTDENVLMMLN